MGAALKPSSHTNARRLRRAAAIGLVVCAALTLRPAAAVAGERYAVIVTGAAGGDEYATKYEKWRTGLATTLRETLGYPADHVVTLGEDERAGAKSTRDNVRQALSEVRKRAVDGDVTLVLLVGHGSADSDGAKFNLVGPDLTIDEWASLIRPIAGRLVFVNASSGSFPFLAALAGRNRVVLTANDSAAQNFETIFPEHFVAAFADDIADTDKNGKVSVLEAFNYASAKVKNAFDGKGQLATERALLDDTGAGVGLEYQSKENTRDGQVAQITYLAPEVPAGLAAANPELATLLRRRADLENRLTLLKAGKESMQPERYEDELERILLEIARIDRQRRAKT